MPDAHTPGPSDADPASHEALRPIDVEETFERALDEGRRRMSRPLVPLLATGFVGGVDVASGVLALFLVETALGHSLGAKLVAGLAFSIGFIAVTMARSELFTEDFLVPVVTVVARQATIGNLLRLWGATLVANLAGGWVIMWLVMLGFPELASTAVASGSTYVDLGIGWHSLALAMLAGVLMTLMTWMQQSTEHIGVKLVPAVTTGFLLIGGGLNHAVISSFSVFAGLHTGQAPYGYGSWAVTAGWAALGNLVGGLLFVTALRLLQVPHRLRAQRAAPPPSVAGKRRDKRPGDDPSQAAGRSTTLE